MSQKPKIVDFHCPSVNISSGTIYRDRDRLVEDFRKVISIDTEDREDMAGRLAESEEALRGLIGSLKERGLEASATYVENLSRGIFTYVRLLLERGAAISRTTGLIERNIREIGRRIKKVGGSWTDKGALNLIKLL